jgi:hypothetical protein
VVNCPAITVTPTTLPNGQQNALYTSQTFTATGGTTAYAWAVSVGSLPAGLALNASTGVLSGTPTAPPGVYNFTVRATDSNACVGTRALSITLTCPTLAIGPATLPNAVQYASYTQALTATNGNTPYTWALITGALPTGMSLSSGGVISGIPTSAPGTFSFTVRATDNSACTQTRAYSLVLDCPVITITPATLASSDDDGGLLANPHRHRRHSAV